MHAGVVLGIDVGNAKVKLCIGAPDTEPRWSSRPLPYDDRRRYERHADFELGVPEAIREALGSGAREIEPEVAVIVTSAGYAYPTFREGVVHLARVVCEALPKTRVCFLSATLELVDASVAAEGDPRVVGPIAFSNPNGGAYLARRLRLLGAENRGLALDTGGQTTGTVVLDGAGVDPVALADPARHTDHRAANGKLVWVGLETTPLEWLAEEATVGGVVYPLIPRGVTFQNVAAVLGLDDAARTKRLALFGLFPTRAQALRALADAVNLDAERASEEALVELARLLHERAIDRLARGLARAIRAAPEHARRRAALFGIGARALALPALLRCGLARDDVVVASDRLRSDLADAASCFGAFHAGLELLHGPVPVFGATDDPHVELPIAAPTEAT